MGGLMEKLFPGKACASTYASALKGYGIESVDEFKALKASEVDFDEIEKDSGCKVLIQMRASMKIYMNYTEVKKLHQRRILTHLKSIQAPQHVPDRKGEAKQGASATARETSLSSYTKMVDILRRKDGTITPNDLNTLKDMREVSKLTEQDHFFALNKLNITAAEWKRLTRRKGKRMALLLANWNYDEQTKLDRPKKDAELLQKTLESERFGFDVALAFNQTKDGMCEALEDFRLRIERFNRKHQSVDQSVEVILIYYSGHGTECKNHPKHGMRAGNLVGVDFPKNSEDKKEWPIQKLDSRRLFLAEVESMFLGVTKESVALFLVDACRSISSRVIFDETCKKHTCEQVGGLSNRALEGFTMVYASRSGTKALDEPTVLRGDKRVQELGYKDSDLKAGSPFAIALKHRLEQSAQAGLATVVSDVCKDVQVLTAGDQRPDVAGNFLENISRLNEIKF